MNTDNSQQVPLRPDHAREELVRGFTWLLESHKGADMTVICQGGSLKCHSSIICPRSPFFSNQYWANRNQDRSITTTINVQDIGLPMLRRVIRYFYVLDYDDAGQDLPAGYPAIKVNGRMFTLGVRFGVNGLQRIAASKFEGNCIRLANPCEEPLRALKLLADVAESVYSFPPETYKELRSSIAKSVGSHFINDQRLLNNLDIAQVCRKYPGFAYDLMVESFKAAHGKV
ncbi:MAG: hypothetical protein LQ350_008332 [Teloschistes chrysophthalmus]|nr:MAG: hypothetical protein LQ350_008332 [Niorma chrysophthalma]